jgi:hypothetical protein
VQKPEKRKSAQEVPEERTRRIPGGQAQVNLDEVLSGKMQRLATEKA